MLTTLLRRLMGKRFLVRLSAVEHEQAKRLATNPSTPPRRRHWMAILLAANEGHSDQEVASQLALSVTTVQRTRQRYAQQGFASLVGPEMNTTAANEPDLSSYRSLLNGDAPIDGLVGTVIVDGDGGTCLAGHIKQLGTIALGNAALMRTALEQAHGVDEILLTDAKFYHLLRVVTRQPAIYLNVVVDRNKSNPALARHQLDTLLGLLPS